jgi:hypothetical protein
MFCTKCGTPNPDTEQFCRNCSAQLVVPRQTARFPQGAPETKSRPGRPDPPPYPNYSGFPVVSSGGNSPVQLGQQGPSNRAIAAVIVSSLSLLICCFPIGLVGTLLAKFELNAIREGTAPQGGEKIAKIGFYLGIVSIVLSIAVNFIFFLTALID